MTSSTPEKGRAVSVVWEKCALGVLEANKGTLFLVVDSRSYPCLFVVKASVESDDKKELETSKSITSTRSGGIPPLLRFPFLEIICLGQRSPDSMLSGVVFQRVLFCLTSLKKNLEKKIFYRYGARILVLLFLVALASWIGDRENWRN